MPSNSCNLRVYEIDDETGERTAVGFLAADDKGMLRVISAETEDDAELLAEMIAEINGQPDLKVRVPPPADAERYELHSEIVERGSAKFIDALREHASRYHSYDLEVTDDPIIDAEGGEYRSDPFRPSAMDAEFEPRDLPDL